jgi:hypothetical protein
MQAVCHAAATSNYDPALEQLDQRELEQELVLAAASRISLHCSSKLRSPGSHAGAPGDGRQQLAVNDDVAAQVELRALLAAWIDAYQTIWINRRRPQLRCA